MVYLIGEGCIDVLDKSCVDACPVDCIQYVEGIDRMLFINPWECIGCGACEPACPVKAIYPEDAVPREQASFIRINGLWYEDADAARAFVNRRKPTD